MGTRRTYMYSTWALILSAVWMQGGGLERASAEEVTGRGISMVGQLRTPGGGGPAGCRSARGGGRGTHARVGGAACQGAVLLRLRGGAPTPAQKEKAKQRKRAVKQFMQVALAERSVSGGSKLTQN